MKSVKKPFKLNVLGIFRLETENMNLIEILLIMIVVMGFVITIVILLKTYALPALVVPGIIKKVGTVIQLIRYRAP
jgi:hypothetical protein